MQKLQMLLIGLGLGVGIQELAKGEYVYGTTYILLAALLGFFAIRKNPKTS